MPRKPKPAPSPIPPALDGLAFPLADLVPDPHNARKHGDRNMAAIRAALERFGWRGVVVANRSTRQIEVGHARVQAALSLGWTHGPVLWVDDPPRTAAAFGIADNRTAELAEWAEDELRAALSDLRDEDDLIAALGFDAKEIEAILSDTSGEAIYERSVAAPIYTPTLDSSPPVADLLVTRKADELLAAIDAAGVPEEVAAFLRVAAQRHTRFNYGKIAEFYAHASPEVQRLMEASALVVIDFGDAIAGGFVQMSKDLADAHPSA